MNEEHQRYLLLFENSLKSEVTKRYYLYYLKKFIEYYKLKDLGSILKIEPNDLQIMVEDYVMYLKKTVSPNTLPTPIYAIESFLVINDIFLNWKKIRKLYPAKVKLSGRSPWSTSNIGKMLEFTSDIRSKALIHFLASTGIRIGAISDLRLKHLAEMPQGCKSVLCYEGSREEYYVFLTPEASSALDRYLEKRRNDGELLKPESPVFRKVYALGMSPAESLNKNSLNAILNRIQYKCGLRVNKEGYRFSTQINHGFRKRFNTILKLNQNINSNIAEKLMGHKNGLDGVYLTPTKEQLFEEFKKAIPDLTIDNSERLRIRNQQLEKEKTELEKKSEENQMQKDELDMIKDEQSRMKQMMENIQKQLKNNSK